MKRVGILAICSMILLVSCKKIDAAKGQSIDNIVNETGFTGIDMTLSGSLVFTEGETTSITVKTTEKVFEKMKIGINNGILEFDMKSGYTLKNGDQINIVVTAPGVSIMHVSGSGTVNAIFDALNNKDNAKLTVSGSGLLDIKNLTSSSLSMRISGSGLLSNTNLVATDSKTIISGSGNLTTEGTSTSSDVKISGSGLFNGFKLITDNSDINISGSGSAEVTANNNLTSDISGSGSVYYKGNPSMNTNSSGSGSVFNAN